MSGTSPARRRPAPPARWPPAWPQRTPPARTPAPCPRPAAWTGRAFHRRCPAASGRRRTSATRPGTCPAASARPAPDTRQRHAQCRQRRLVQPDGRHRVQRARHHQRDRRSRASSAPRTGRSQRQRDRRVHQPPPDRPPLGTPVPRRRPQVQARQRHVHQPVGAVQPQRGVRVQEGGKNSLKQKMQGGGKVQGGQDQKCPAAPPPCEPAYSGRQTSVASRPIPSWSVVPPTSRKALPRTGPPGRAGRRWSSGRSP